MSSGSSKWSVPVLQSNDMPVQRTTALLPALSEGEALDSSSRLLGNSSAMTPRYTVSGRSHPGPLIQARGGERKVSANLRVGVRARDDADSSGAGHGALVSPRWRNCRPSSRVVYFVACWHRHRSDGSRGRWSRAQSQRLAAAISRATGPHRSPAAPAATHQMAVRPVAQHPVAARVAATAEVAAVVPRTVQLGRPRAGVTAGTRRLPAPCSGRVPPTATACSASVHRLGTAPSGSVRLSRLSRLPFPWRFSWIAQSRGTPGRSVTTSKPSA